MDIVNTQVLNQLAEDISPQDLRIVVQTFESDLHRLGGALTASAAAGDLVAFRRSAHAIAGAAGAVGATAIEHAARRAMQVADQDAARATADAAGLIGLAGETITALRRMVERVSRPA